jgi:hypothetical protein
MRVRHVLESMNIAFKRGYIYYCFYLHWFLFTFIITVIIVKDVFLSNLNEDKGEGTR